MREVNIYDKLSNNPIIAAIKDEKDLEAVLESDVEVIFVLQSSLLTIKEVSKKIEQSGKVGFVHMGLVKGLSDDEVGLRYLKENTSFSGIISTKWPQLVRAQALGFMTVYRIFMVDSLAFNSLKKAQNPKFPDFIEILPNASGKIIKSVNEQIKRPLIVSGLITDKEDVINALKHGAIAISSTNKKVWEF
ncbi:glycerol-3-phosphate responsive antiterminator [Vagococcus sp. DIV0080]|uniref:Glycerol uptake operon antiterminator regulatory protein n=1 Tax=Candidatus Vagococcus giribetii TaxID=2230876 RepID=A0ABS3HRM9_9ENTE|nr:glycerol-3-phosphate responsive antiterminator [Vagococcus sp. DIV0080]